MSKVPLGRGPKLNDIVILKNDDWLGKIYSDSDAKIINVPKNGVFYDVEAFDGKLFSVTRSQFYTIDEYWDDVKKKPIPKCECGSVYSDFPQHHMFYCPLYRDIMEGK